MIELFKNKQHRSLLVSLAALDSAQLFMLYYFWNLLFFTEDGLELEIAFIIYSAIITITLLAVPYLLNQKRLCEKPETLGKITYISVIAALLSSFIAFIPGIVSLFISLSLITLFIFIPHAICLARIALEFPDKLIGFAVMPPAGATAEIERCYSAGLTGVGELFPAGQGINLEDKNETDTIADTCSRLGIPLMLHINEPVGHLYPGKTDVPLRQFETFALNYPSLRIILAHFGGGIFLYETMKEIKESFKNVYYDTAIAPYLYDYRIYNAVKALGLCDKLLFGSDYPILPPSRYFSALQESDLNDKEKKMILGGNLQKILTSCNIL